MGIWGTAMDGLGALLTDLKRVLTSAPLEALLVGLLVALLLGLAFLLVRRRTDRRTEDVEHLFLASAAATRKSREISEIDAFARRASATAEDLKTRVRKLRIGHFQQV